MTLKEINEILGSFLMRKAKPYDKPASSDWEFLRNKFNCTFNKDFVAFYELIGEYQFYGELLGIALSGYRFTQDTIAFVYDHETKNGAWPSAMLPFYAVGNGDYICVNKLQGDQSPVYYVDHEDSRLYINSETLSLEAIYPDFAAWIEDSKEYIS